MATNTTPNSMFAASGADPYQLLYQQITGRAPDAEGLAYWKNQFGTEIDPQEQDIFRKTALSTIAKQAFNRELSDAEKADLFKLSTTKQASDWAGQKGQEWFNNQFNQQYTDLATGADQSANLSKYLKDKFQSFGLTDFADIEKQVIPAKQAKTAGSGMFSNQALNQFVASKFDKDYTEQTKYYNKATGQEIDPVLFDDKVGTKYILTDQGIQKQFDPLTRFAAQLTAYVDPSSTGGAWGTKGGKKSPPGFGPEGMMRQIASRVQSNTGVSDINDLGVRKVEGLVEQTSGGGDYPTDTTYLNPKTNQITYSPYEIYNKKTGQKIRDGSYIDLGGWGEGPGITYASMTFDANGKPKISTYGEDTNTLADYQPLMTLASIIPPIQPFAVAVNAANAAYNYGNFAPAIMAAAGASGILDSIAGSAGANSGIAGLAQDLGASANLANSIGRVGAQTLLGSTLSAAQGKGVLPGAKSGFVSGVIGEGVNTLGEMTGLNKGLGSLANPAKSFVSSALTSAALGTPFNFSEAAKNAAMRYGVGEISKLAGLTPQQGKAVNSFLEYLSKKK